MAVVTLQEWEAYTREYPDAHILQLGDWGELKSGFGWRVGYVIRGDIGAQILFRPIPGGFTVAYIPKGPIFPGMAEQACQYDIHTDVKEEPGWPDFWLEVDRLCKQERAIFLKVDPDCWEPVGEATITPTGFRQSDHSIQPPKTILVDLQVEPDEILGRMKQKTRYNIRLAAKKGVKIGTSKEVSLFHDLMEKTGKPPGLFTGGLDGLLSRQAGLVSVWRLERHKTRIDGFLCHPMGSDVVGAQPGLCRV